MTTDGSRGAAAQLVLATLRARQGDAVAASTMAREAAALFGKLPGNLWGGEYSLLNPVILALLAKGKLAEAEVMQRTILEFVVARDGRDSKAYSLVSAYLAKTLIRSGRFNEAEPLAREAWELRKKYWPANDWAVPEAQSVLGEVELGAKKYPEAEATLTAAFAAMQKSQPANLHAVVAWRLRLHEVAGLLVRLCEGTQQSAKAGEWMQKAAEYSAAAAKPSTS